MKRFGLAVAVCGLLASSIAGTAVAGAANGDGGPYDFVSGAIKRIGLNNSVERHFILSAHDGPQGAHGSYTATYGKGRSSVGYKGDVTCVQVVGNVARVGIRITESSDSEAAVGLYEILRVTDYGTPGDDGQQDSLSPGAFTTTPADCSGPYYPDPTPTYSGNFSMHDAG
jgi:hypothetical protein